MECSLIQYTYKNIRETELRDTRYVLNVGGQQFGMTYTDSGIVPFMARYKVRL
mgnify:FL=1